MSQLGGEMFNSTKNTAQIRAFLLIIAIFIGPIHLTLFAQADCTKYKGYGAYRGHGTRWASQCTNSGFQNSCKWLDCNGSMFCTQCSGAPTFSCPGPESTYPDAFIDSCSVGYPTFKCSCQYNTCCSGLVIA